ncbi:unnamed protein product [Discosporangium mesarthrocarpum]
MASGSKTELKPRSTVGATNTVVPGPGDNDELGRWYWLFRLMGVYSKGSQRALLSMRLLQACLNNADYKRWYTDGKISNEFLPKHLWLSTNVWIISRRLLREGEEGKKIQQLLFDELWKETIRHMRSMEVTEMFMNKYLKETQQYTFGTLVQYDHAYTLEDEEERIDMLAGALWRGVYMRSEEMDGMSEEHVLTLARYIDGELQGMLQVPQVRGGLGSRFVFMALRVFRLEAGFCLFCRCRHGHGYCQRIPKRDGSIYNSVVD